MDVKLNLGPEDLSPALVQKVVRHGGKDAFAEAHEDLKEDVGIDAGYVENNLTRMDYPRYRKLGLPISSAPVESVIKQFNRRVKGTEKFWLKSGAEAVLQVRAAYLSQDGRVERLWARPRPHYRAVGRNRSTLVA